MLQDIAKQIGVSNCCLTPVYVYESQRTVDNLNYAQNITGGGAEQ